MKSAGGKIDVGQYELHPWLPRSDIVEWLQKRNIVVQAYSPLVQATRMEDPALQPLVKKYNKTPAQILIRWSLQKVRHQILLSLVLTRRLWSSNTDFIF